MRPRREPNRVGPALRNRSHRSVRDSEAVPSHGHGGEPIVVWGGTGRQGRRGEPAKASPVRALILMGDWCASFEARHPKPDDAGAQPSEFQRPGPAQRATGARLKRKMPLA